MKENLEQLKNEVEKEIKPIFEKIDKICEINSKKVLEAFQKCDLQEAHLNSSTGYGIDEPGRNKIEEIYSKVFKAEDALVRTQLISGTHALAVTLSALLRPGDTMISITGEPYDTLQTVIGITGESKSSLKEFGVKYEQIELINNDFDIEKIKERLSKKDVKLVEIQRSRDGTSFKRARFHSSLMDGRLLERGEKNWDKLPEQYVIFFIEKDIFGDDEPIYHIESVILES